MNCVLISEKTTFFIVTAVKTSNHTTYLYLGAAIFCHLPVIVKPGIINWPCFKNNLAEQYCSVSLAESTHLELLKLHRHEQGRWLDSTHEEKHETTH
jgi:hypothetical protein